MLWCAVHYIMARPHEARQANVDSGRQTLQVELDATAAKRLCKRGKLLAHGCQTLVSMLLSMAVQLLQTKALDALL